MLVLLEGNRRLARREGGYQGDDVPAFRNGERECGTGNLVQLGNKKPVDGTDKVPPFRVVRKNQRRVRVGNVGEHQIPRADHGYVERRVLGSETARFRFGKRVVEGVVVQFVQRNLAVS